MNRDSNIYVAGHKGLVGSAIWRCLWNKGYRNLTGRTLEELDLRDPAAVSAFFQQEKPEYVFLAAARVGGIVANNTYRAEFIYDNLMIQNNIVHQSFLSGVKKLLFLGSTCIYPRDCPQPMKEEYLLSSPLEYTNEPYAIAKIAGIRLCESYNIQHGTNFLAVMPTNLYGPNDNFDLEKSHVLPALLRKIHLGRCLESNDWAAIRADLDKRPVHGVSGGASEGEILKVLQQYGVGWQDGGASEGEIRQVLQPDGVSRQDVVATDGETQPVPEQYGAGRQGGQSSLRGRVVVEIWGSGKPLREFLWSEDMAEACVFVMEHVNFEQLVREKEEVRNTHINIGTGIEVSVRELASLIREIVGFGGELVFDTGKPDGTMRKLTDPTKLNNMGWRHSVNLEEGIQRLYAWYLNEARSD